MSEPNGRVAGDQMDSLVVVLDLVRSGAARTRPELTRLSGLGRNVITQRVGQLTEAGLFAAGSLAPSTGGRAPRELRLRAEAGVVLVAHLGATSVSVAMTDLAGQVLHRHVENGDIAAGPQSVLARVETLFDRLLESDCRPARAAVYGIGLGLPGPVEFATGRPVSPPIMPGWDRYPVREHLAKRYLAPVWVDNDVNLLALGEQRRGSARGLSNVIYVKVGTGIGAGLVSNGLLHRGAQGCAGDIGHVAVPAATNVICRCGNVGCLEALAGGAALARDGVAAAHESRSPALAGLLAAGKSIGGADVVRAAQQGDGFALGLVARAGRLVGETLATLVNFFDPALIILGGEVVEAGDHLLASIRETIYQRSLPLATRDLQITRSTLGREAGLVGAAFMVIDELFARERLGLWLGGGSPAGHPEIAAAVT